MVFYIVARVFKTPERVEKAFVLTIASTIFLTIYLRIRYGFESQWFISTVGIIEGAIVAAHEEKIKAFLIQHRLFCLLLSMTAILLAFALSLKTSYYHMAINAVAPFIVYETTCICGSLKSSLLSWIGGISLEIYLVQGVITKLLRIQQINILMLVIYSIALSILFASLLVRIKKPILSWLNYLHSRN